MMNSVNKVLIITVLLHTLGCYGQSSLILNIAQQSGNHKQAEIVLNRLHHFDSVKNKDSLNYYILKGRSLCKQIKNSSKNEPTQVKLAGEIYGFIANNLAQEHQFSRALSTYNKAQLLYESIGEKSKVASCFNKKGAIYHIQNNQINALSNYSKANNIYKQLRDSTHMAITFVNIAQILIKQEDYQKAQETLEKASSVLQNVNNPAVLSRIKSGFALIKINLGEPDKALVLMQEALSLAKTSNNKKLVAQTLNNIGDVYIEKKKFEKSKDFYSRALKFATENKHIEVKAISLNNIGKYYFNTQQYNKAIDYASQALKISEKTAKEDVKTKAITLLKNIYEKKGNWEKAFYYQKLLIQQAEKKKQSTIEQVLLQEKVRLDEEKNKFLERKKEVEDTLVTEQESQHKIGLYVAGGAFFILLIIVLLVIYIRLRASREKNKYISKQSLERKLLLQEVHHRVKNNFQIVSSMLRLQSNKFDDKELKPVFNEAISRINAMAIVHEIIYQQDEFRDIDVKSYLENLIKILQKTSHYKVRIVVESESFPLKIQTLISLGIILNELITNSYKHAFNDQVENPTIKIILKEMGENSYELNYKDNGVGISKELSSNFGMELIETIISNYDGSVSLINEPQWPTSIKIKFLEF